jgi:hypothetical protein
MADPLGSLVDVIAGLVDRLEASGFPYALGGAVAYSSWGEPRATRDVDLNLWVEATRLVDMLGPDAEQVTAWDRLATGP